jgi:hypothetical protein
MQIVTQPTKKYRTHSQFRLKLLPEQHPINKTFEKHPKLDHSQEKTMGADLVSNPKQPPQEKEGVL